MQFIELIKMRSIIPLLLTALTLILQLTGFGDCKGMEIGRFHSFMHGIKGYVSVLDDETLEISGMTYDGEGPGSWFVVGNDDDYTKEFVDLDATVIPDETNRLVRIKAMGIFLYKYILI